MKCNRKDVMEIANVRKDMALKIIRELNAELKASGYIIIKGRIPATYLIKDWELIDKI